MASQAQTAEDMLAGAFGLLPELIAAHACERPGHRALIQDKRTLTYAQLDAQMDRIAAALQRDGVSNGDVVAVCAATSIEYACVYLGALRAGAAVAPLAPSSTAQSLAVMIADCAAKVLFLDQATGEALVPVAGAIAARRVALDGSTAGEAFEAWLAAPGARPEPVVIDPAQAFNIIYSSGTTGAPKGIVQSHAMRWRHIAGATCGPRDVTMVCLGLYSNTTLVSFLPAVGKGGTAVLMAKWNAEAFLRQSEQHRATHAMLVPVLYRRLMVETPDFDQYDLSSYAMKYCTSAPFSAELKAQVLARWPGGLVEFYGMTEGGGSCALLAHEHPDKLNTVGQPMEGHDIRIIDEDGKVLPPGAVGEIVGRSAGIMNGYHNQPDKTAETVWREPVTGEVFVRTGDVGRFDADGFLQLMDRKKDMIISGGFNIYPSDLEAVIAGHEAVAEAAVVGVPSDAWGETPVAYVVLRPGADATAAALRDWTNARVGKTQRLADVVIAAGLPRSHIGKILKRELRDSYAGMATA